MKCAERRFLRETSSGIHGRKEEIGPKARGFRVQEIIPVHIETHAAAVGCAIFYAGTVYAFSLISLEEQP